MPAQVGGFRWITPPDELQRNLDTYAERVLVAIQAVALRITTIMQDDAQRNAPWTDRTGNARRGIFGTAEREVAEKIVAIYLSHGSTIDYGIWLELANGGRHAIIMRTIEGHLPELWADVHRVLQG